MDTLVPVTFRFPSMLAPKAQQVAIVGTFNGWHPTANLLTKTPGGDWTITVYLTLGRTLYYFAVDGIWWLDPHDDGRVPNGWGSEYSVRYIRQEPTVSRGCGPHGV